MIGMQEWHKQDLLWIQSAGLLEHPFGPLETMTFLPVISAEVVGGEDVPLRSSNRPSRVSTASAYR